jgi:alpha-D-ribose 1-methylphosphonate 5-triphosphate synthase subunit PhnG
MFQAFDNDTPDQSLIRADWISMLARAPLDLLESALEPYSFNLPQWLRQPETGLMMVQARAGATGERFNLGEVTVTRCALRLNLEDSPATLVGVAYVLGRSHRHARLAATADALLQDPAQHKAIEANLLEPVRQHLAAARSARFTRAQSTKVEFFTVAREAGSPDEEADNE